MCQPNIDGRVRLASPRALPEGPRTVSDCRVFRLRDMTLSCHPSLILTPESGVCVLCKTLPGSWLGFPWQTLWSKQRIASNSRALFTSVFVPYPAAAGRAAAQTVAEGIDVVAAGDGVVVTLTPHGAATALTVSLDVHGNWSVAR